MKKFELFYAILTQTATSEEKLLFEELMSDAANKRLFEQLKKIWLESAELKTYQMHDVAKSFYQMQQKIQNRKLQRKRYITTSLSGIAAGIIILFGLFKLSGSQHLPFDSFQQVHFQTEFGNRSVVHLPDGSKVWLNAQSDLRYNAGFNVSDRSVFLSGEAYFEVAKGEKLFVVDVNDLKVKVYGTKFNVSAYDDDPVIQTCLETGKISIHDPKSKEYEAKPGELVLYEKSTKEFKIKSVNPEEYAAWRMNKLYMHNEPLHVLAKKLERKYNINIEFKPSTLGDKIHYTGVFGNENLEEILEAITMASRLKYQKNGNHYQIIQ